MTGKRLDAVIVGAGGIGILLAVRLHEAGRSVALCSRAPLPAITIADAAGERAVPIPVVTRPAALSSAPVVLLATKAQDTGAARPWIEAASSPGTVLVLAQNGVDHVERFSRPPEGVQVLPSVVGMSSERLAPGRIRHHSGKELLLPATDAGSIVVDLFSGSGVEASLAPDFHTASWRKLVANCAANPITALTLRRFEVFRLPAIRELAVRVVCEAIEVGRACGADLGAEDVGRVAARWDAQPSDGITSMLADRLAGRPLEHEYLLGPVVSHGRARGIPTPATELLWTLIAAAGPVHAQT
jgi:2-dehydropantoate 2-reductase